MNAVIKDLNLLLDISPTSERYSLIGSGYKRKSILTSGLTHKTKALGLAAYNYMKAHNSPNNNNKAYTLCNWLEMENILVLLGDRKWGDEITNGKDSYKLMTAAHSLTELKTLRTSFMKDNDDMDYWKLLAIANIELCNLIIDPASTSDEKVWEQVLLSYRKIWSKAGSKGNKLAEIEHLELLKDGLSQSKKRDVVKLRKKLEGLKEELVKMT